MQKISDLIPGLTPKLTTTAESQTTASKSTGWRPQFDAYEPSLKAAAQACAKFVADMERDVTPYWLTLTGVNGCGKSYLMRQVFAEAKRINPGNPSNNPIWPPNWQDSTQRVYEGRRPYVLMLNEQDVAARMRAR